MDEIEVYVVWDMNADSMTRPRTMVSIHQTLEGAEKVIPERFKTETYDRTEQTLDDYVKNYTYLAIEKKTIGE